VRNRKSKIYVQDGLVSLKRLHLNLFRALVALALFSLLMGNVARPAQGVALNSRLVWSAGFETGNAKQFNDTSILAQPSSVTLSVSKQVAETGQYSAYYTYVGSTHTGISLRGYQTEVLSQRLPIFYVEFWVYVPSNVNGKQVHITPDWISFASLWVNQDGSDTGGTPICVNSDSGQQIHVNVHPINKILFSTNPIKWPFDRWFSIGIYGELHPGTANSKLIIYQNGQQIISFVGDLGLSSDGLGQMHFGLYASDTQGTLSIYNDNIQVYSP
jgi:hypothetical protein